MPEWTKSSPQRLSVGFLLFDRFSNLCLANCIEPLRAANALGQGPGFDWTILSPDGAPCRSSSGIEVIAQSAISDMARLDYLFVIASYGYQSLDTAQTRRALRSAVGRAGTVIGLDSGPWLMAAAGMLDGRRATLHWDELDAFAERFLAVQAERAHVVRDGAMITCAGAMSALDLTLDLIAQHCGVATKLDVEGIFMRVDSAAHASAGAPKPDPDPLVRRALDKMREAIENPISLSDLARGLSCQPRTLDRRFRARLGASPGQVYRHLRLAAARKLVEGSRLGVAEIALRCGYDSPAALTRAFRRQYGCPPRSLRRD